MVRLPAEWEHQTGVLLTWPEDGGAWGENRAEQVNACFSRITREIAMRENVLLAVRNATHGKAIADRLARDGMTSRWPTLFTARCDDVWSRDHGPISVYTPDNLPKLLDFRFNGWGGKYPAENDDHLSRRLHGQGAFGNTPMRSLDLVLEGGAIESDGAGTILATERCLLDPRRNPGMTRSRMESLLQQHLGADRVLWLTTGGLAGDDTDGHIDTLARFTDTDHIVYQGCARPEDEHHAPLGAMAEELACLRTRSGAPYRLQPLPLPPPIHDAAGQRLPAGYANFLLINGAVLMPTYDCHTDPPARRILAACFPGRDIIEIDCRILLQQYGSLHCLTMQLPAPAPQSRSDADRPRPHGA